MPRTTAALLLAGAALAGLQACTTAGGSAPTAAPVPATTGLALVPMAELRKLARTTPWECVNYDEASHTCESVARTTWRDDRHGTSRLALLAQRSPRVVVALSAPTWAEGDLECGRMADATVEVGADRSLPEDAAERAEAEIRRALASDRTVTCAGLVRDGAHFRVVGYRDGRLTGSSTALRLFAEPPALRPRDGEA